MKDFSLKARAAARYFLTSEYHSRYLRQLQSMIGQHDTDYHHPHLLLPRIRELICNSSCSLWKKKLVESIWSWAGRASQFVNCSRGTTKSVQGPSWGLSNRGGGIANFQARELARGDFINVVPWKITKEKLKTFTDIGKKLQGKWHGKEVVLKADMKLFG